MASDYGQILSDNLEAYGKSTKLLQLLKTLYADRTHFLYELIQNAEDAGATRMSLILSQHKLEVLHDGRLFTESDVRGICGVAEGSKEHDLTQIGRFGIGFKSVYAFTSRPEVHCGDEHFAIEDFVRPRATGAETVPPGWTTLFRLPLDEPAQEGGDGGFEKIGSRLQRLDPLTLLFLRHIREIKWTIAEGGHGVYRREEPEAGQNPRRVWVVGEGFSDGQTRSTEDRWYIFSRSVNHLVPGGEPGEQARQLDLRVEVAFRDQSNDSESGVTISRLADSPLAVFFLTEYETRLGFLIQGPYRTTPARDNIPKDDAWNRLLVGETSRLVVHSLEQLKQKGLLTVQALEVMPLKALDFAPGTFCEPIFLAVRQALREGAFLPAEGGELLPASETKLGVSSALRALLGPAELAELKNVPSFLHWISSEITPERNGDLRSYIGRELGVEEIDSEDFAQQLSGFFLAGRSDSWMVRFYSFLRGQQALWREGRRDYYGGYQRPGTLRSKPIIRLEDGQHVPPFGFDGLPDAYLPLEGDDLPTDLPTVRASIAFDKSARVFLEKELGLPAPDAVARILERVLPRYKCPLPDVAREQNRIDLRRILDALEKSGGSRRQELMSALREACIFRATNYASKDEAHYTGSGVYLDSAELHPYFDGNPDAWFLHREYDEDIRKLARDLGAREQVKVSCRVPYGNGVVAVLDQWGRHVQGIDGFDPECNAEGLDWALRHLTPARSRFIWNHIAVQYAPHLKGVRQTRSNEKDDWQSETRFSPLGETLAKTAWLPSMDGVPDEFLRPSQLGLADLPDGFEPSARVAVALGMRSDEKQNAAQALGVSLEEVNLARRLREYPDFYQKVAEWLERREGTEFPTGAVRDPQLRKDRVTQQVREATKKIRQRKEQTVRTSSDRSAVRQDLRSLYTNADGAMVCQLCREVMPFRMPDGQFYFEAVEILSTVDLEMDQMYLALCPTCAAKYKVFVKDRSDEMEKVRAQILRCDPRDPTQQEVICDFGKDEPPGSLRFREEHLMDIQTIVENAPH